MLCSLELTARCWTITLVQVEKMYFGSHLFRDPHSMRERLVEGLSQASMVCYTSHEGEIM